MLDEPGAAPPDEPDEVDPRPVGNAAMVRRARSRYGVIGAAMAGAMIAVRDLLEKPKDDTAVVVEAASEPTDIDEDGITVPLDDGRAATAPALPRAPARPDVAREWAARRLDRKRR